MFINQVQAQVETNVQSLILEVGNLFGNIITLLFAIALVIFVWGLAKFILNSGDEGKVEDGKRLMFWGIVALFVATSIWGIVTFLQTTFGVGP